MTQPVFYMGIGHERGADLTEALALAERCCREAGLPAGGIALVASIEHKEEEGIVAAIAKHYGCQARYFPAAALEAETPRLLNPSESVFRALGCHGVAEAAALAAAGQSASLMVPKTKGIRVTCAIARRCDHGR